MNMPLGKDLSIRSMVYIAAEKVPFFWPMRAFIHHNPLHGLEHLPFEQAVEQGTKMFNARAFLPRSNYQNYLNEKQVDLKNLRHRIETFAKNRDYSGEISLSDWLFNEICSEPKPLVDPGSTVLSDNVFRAIHDKEPLLPIAIDTSELSKKLSDKYLHGHLVYEIIDELYGLAIGKQLDEAVIRATLDFFDEGQSVWNMPNREQGFFHAWLETAGRDVQKTFNRLVANEADHKAVKPESIIDKAFRELRIDEQQQITLMAREFTRLHGWVGFIRWRSNNNQYYWQQRYPGDLVDYLAVRLLLQLTLIRNSIRKDMPANMEDIRRLIENKPVEVYLRQQMGSGEVLVEMAQQVEQAIETGRSGLLEKVYVSYTQNKCLQETALQKKKLLAFAENLQLVRQLKSLDEVQFKTFYSSLKRLYTQEGIFWLQAMESHATGDLLQDMDLQIPPLREKRPFAKALFCIDTRSERIRRHLESIGDYETYGIAGFFGVPLSFMELGKGSEQHLCPVLLTPKNLVIEMTPSSKQDIAAFSTLEHALHELKESVLTPFVTVEAIGLLFGFDMIGKTLMPVGYSQWRNKMHEDKPSTHLMIDKITREQADSVVRAVQRAVIKKAVSQEFRIEVEQVSDNMIKELREASMGYQDYCPEFSREMKLTTDEVHEFVHRLRSAYKINRKISQIQMERLGRIGFSLEEQVRFVAVALQSIGLNNEFSRFIVMVGHGSRSENNPYESALDCGACGGSHGLVSARVISQMANKAEVREGLLKQGIDIPDDTWFVPALHNTTTDEVTLHDLALLPPTHLTYLDRLREGLTSASRLCAHERVPTLQTQARHVDALHAFKEARRNSLDWSQVRPEWGLSRNAYFIIGRRSLTHGKKLDGRAFLHSYDYRLDPKRHLLENILTGPLVVGQWINMEHYFSTVDNDRFGSGSKVYHNVAGRFGVMTGNFSDLRTGLPSQTVLKNGQPYHQPMRLITVIEAPFDMAWQAVEGVVSVKRLVRNEWIRLVIIDPETSLARVFENGQWHQVKHFDETLQTEYPKVVSA